MRQAEFPFAKYRDWGKIPENMPEFDVDVVADLVDWQDRIYKRPILDDITGYYQFYPSENGASSYVTRASKRRPVVLDKIAEGDTLEQKQQRQIEHIAESAELATALFWTASIMRHDVLSNALSTIADDAENNTQDTSALTEHTAIYSADAIADYGYCLVYPVDKDHTGKDHGPALKAQIDRVAPGIGQTLLDFGNYAYENPESLRSYEGVVAMQATMLEQERRWKHWSPRHQAVVSAFPQVVLSREILELAPDFPEIYSLHNSVRVS